MCKSNITARKFLKLFCEVKFYQIVIFVIFLIAGYETFSPQSVFSLLLPVSEISDNFESCYLVFFLFIPFINKLISNINEQQHRILLLLCFVAYIAFGTFHRITINYVSWFIVLYLFASYLRIYPKDIYSRTSVWGVSTVLCVIISAVSIVISTWYGVRTDEIGKFYHYFVSDTNSFLPVVTGISSFLLFKSLKIQYSRIINIVASSTFGVLCIHANSNAMRQWLWKDTLDVAGHYNAVHMPLYSLISVFSIFILCVLIDQLRIHFIEKPFLIWIDKLLEKRTRNG